MDFTTDSSGAMDSITEYLCYSILGVEYEEVRIATREASVSDDTLTSLVSVLETQGIEYNKLYYVNHTGCSDWP